MTITNLDVISLVDYVKVDASNIVCNFKCKRTNKSVISVVAFEPYDGKIEILWKDAIMHPIKSYNRYYHTPITIFSNDAQETIILKAFKKVSNSFIWDAKTRMYIHS